MIIEEADRLNALVERLLGFARAPRGASVPVDLARLAAERLDGYRPRAAERGVVVSLVATDQLVLVDGDTNRLAQVLDNVIQNALDAMPNGGTLRLTVSAVDPGNGTYGRVRIVVEDTGCGIAPDAAARLFEPFVTTKPGGTGLGLAIAYEIVRAHGGEIRVRSPTATGPGTAIEIILSAAPPGARPVFTRDHADATA
jgi:signal transduction histidine kinase